MDKLALCIAVIFVIDSFIFSFLEYRDGKRGDINHRDYTLWGTMRLMRKERKQKRQIKKEMRKQRRVEKKQQKISKTK